MYNSHSGQVTPCRSVTQRRGILGSLSQRQKPTSCLCILLFVTGNFQHFPDTLEKYQSKPVDFLFISLVQPLFMNKISALNGTNKGKQAMSKVS